MSQTTIPGSLYHARVGCYSYGQAQPGVKTPYLRHVSLRIVLQFRREIASHNEAVAKDSSNMTASLQLLFQ